MRVTPQSPTQNPAPMTALSHRSVPLVDEQRQPDAHDRSQSTPVSDQQRVVGKHQRNCAKERRPSERATHFCRPASKVAIVLTAVLLVASADSAHADTTQVLAFANSVSAVFDNIRNWLVGILAGLATVFLTVGGVRYLMASGDPSEVEKAKTAFKSAGWGYALAALAPLVVTILQGIVGG